MHVRTARGVTLAAAVGLVMSGGAALAAESTTAAPEATPAVDVDWAAGTALPVGATRFDAETVGKKVYVLGFRAADGTSTDGSIWVYDIKKKKWKDTGDDMAVPISNYTIAALEDDNGLGLYTFGGREASGETSTVVQVYYPKNGNTVVLDEDPWPGMTTDDCVSLPATGVAVVDNTAYAIGGMSFSTSVPPCTDAVTDEVWSFNPTAKDGKKWKKQAKLKVPRGYISPAVIGNTIYAVGGDLNEAGTLVASPVVEAWKAGSKKWNDTKYADLPVGCDESQAFGFSGGDLGGTITLAGCGQWPATVPDVYQYDVDGDSWDMVGTLIEARRNHAGTNIGTATKPKLMVVGGYGPDGASIIASTEIGTAGGGAPFSGSPSQAPGAVAGATTH